MITMALGNAPAKAEQAKIEIGVAMALFDDVWLTYVREAITKWGTTRPDVRRPRPVHHAAGRLRGLAEQSPARAG